MKTFKKLFWSIVFSGIALSCSDDAKESRTSLDQDESSKVSLAAFTAFVENRYEANAFVNGSAGLTFVENDPCSAVSEAVINGEYVNLLTTSCYVQEDLEFPREYFFIANPVELPTGRPMFISALFTFSDNPQTGTYPVTFECDFYCYYNIVVEAYTLNDFGDVSSRYTGLLQEVQVVNEGNTFSVSFEGNFYSWWWGDQIEPLTISATLSCCDI